MQMATPDPWMNFEPGKYRPDAARLHFFLDARSRDPASFIYIRQQSLAAGKSPALFVAGDAGFSPLKEAAMR
jgi:hypothetical protein